MEAAGIEPCAENRGNLDDDVGGGAESGAPAVDMGRLDGDLAIVIAAWPRLPGAIKRGILAMVGADTTKSDGA